jgi:excisionase family DNA binding protein
MTYEDIPPGRAGRPLTVTVRQACELTGLGPTTIWKLLHERRLQAVRPAGYRRTLIVYDSLARLLAPDSGADSPECKKPGRQRKPLKYSDPDCATSPTASGLRQLPRTTNEMQRPRRLTGAEIQLRQRAARPTPPASTKGNIHAP